MRTIKLTNGMEAKVDDSDYERLSAYRWYGTEGRRGAWYAQRQWDEPLPGGGRKHFVREMQRDVLDPTMVATRDMISDHRNHDTLDNQSHNLRWKNYRGSVLNRRQFLNNTSGYRGVSWERSSGTWRVAIRSLGVRYVTHRADLLEAARAYNELARIHHGEEAVLNIIPGDLDDD